MAFVGAIDLMLIVDLWKRRMDEEKNGLVLYTFATHLILFVS
jgi:hypothetical protein